MLNIAKPLAKVGFGKTQNNYCQDRNRDAFIHLAAAAANHSLDKW